MLGSRTQDRRKDRVVPLGEAEEQQCRPANRPGASFRSSAYNTATPGPIARRSQAPPKRRHLFRGFRDDLLKTLDPGPRQVDELHVRKTSTAALCQPSDLALLGVPQLITLEPIAQTASATEGNTPTIIERDLGNMRPRYSIGTIFWIMNTRPPGAAGRHDHLHAQRIHEKSRYLSGRVVANRAPGSSARRQDPAGDPAVRGNDAHLTLDVEAVANDGRKIVQYLGQVPSRVTLGQDSGHEETRVNQRNALGKVPQRLRKRKAEVLLVVEQLELRTDGSGNSSATIARPVVNAWPARIALANRSIASGNCSSNFNIRRVRIT